MILYAIWYDWRTTMRSLYHRLILGISLFDFCSSTSLIVLGPWAVPEHVEFTKFGRGTFTTCATAGFFFNFVFGTMWYSSFLALHFLLVVKFERQESKLALRFEPIAHAIPILIVLITSSYGVVEDLFNPMRELPGWCWYMDYPPYCSTREGTPECIRGEKYEPVSSTAGPSTVIPNFLIVIGSMIMIVLKVRHTEKQLRQYGHGQNGNLQRTKETAWQGLLYIFAFLIVYFPIVLLYFFGNRNTDDSKHKRVIFGASLMTKLLTPLQGFFNAYIYFNKRFWMLTREGECFELLRRIPVLGGWISDGRRATSGVRNVRPRSNHHNKPDNGYCQTHDEFEANSRTNQSTSKNERSPEEVRPEDEGTTLHHV